MNAHRPTRPATALALLALLVGALPWASTAGCSDDRSGALGGAPGEPGPDTGTGEGEGEGVLPAEGEGEASEGEGGAGGEVLDPDGDEDGDLLSNGDEARVGTDPWHVDTDQDGLLDLAEVGIGPQATDSDGDGIPDALETEAADHDLDGIRDPEDPAEGWQIVSVRFDPHVIRNDRREETRIEIRIAGAVAPSEVQALRSTDPDSPFPPEPAEGIYIDGDELGRDPVDLFDDGSHGDRVAGDGLWSRGGITTSLRTDFSARRIDTWFLDGVTVVDGGEITTRRVWEGYLSGRSLLQSGVFRLGIVDHGAVQEPTRRGEGAFVTGHAANVVAPDASAEIYRHLKQSGRIQEAAKAFYDHFADDYDLLYVVAPEMVLSGNAGVTINASSSVRGIGTDPFDNTADYGSAGRLQSVIGLDFHANGPILHETCHRWGVFLDRSFGFMSTHWGNAGTAGQLGGFDPDSLIDNRDGTWSVDRFSGVASGGDSVPYGPAELYLMGLLPPGDLEPFPVLRQARAISNAGNRMTFEAAGVDWVDVAAIEAIHGPRRPAAGEAQRAFTGAFVVVSERPLTASEMTFVDVQAELLGRARGDGHLLSFEEATGGRATLDTQIH